jgi:hypothetical protein
VDLFSRAPSDSISLCECTAKGEGFCFGNHMVNDLKYKGPIIICTALMKELNLREPAANKNDAGEYSKM